jgi:hypothetical protein
MKGHGVLSQKTGIFKNTALVGLYERLRKMLKLCLAGLF